MMFAASWRATALSLILLIIAATPAQAFKPNEAGHLGITTMALTPISRVVEGRTLKFSARAIKQIRDANKAVDLSGSFFGVAEHFDDENFAGATARIVTLKNSVIARITATPPDGAAARSDLGGALHTLQDFYAHSNWVDTGHATIQSSLGRSSLIAPGPGTATCPMNPGQLGGAGLTVTTSGYFPFPNPCAAPPMGKCRHGVNLLCPDGLNKDEASRLGYAAARQLAILATTDLLNQILDAPGVVGNAKAIRALMDLRSLGMAIDTTGSMGEVIAHVKTQVGQIVDQLRGSDEEPSEYVLVPFNDPDVGTAFTTDNADAFLSAVNALTADGGEDCPELSMTGLLRAVAATPAGGDVYLFTDASAKDSELVGNVSAQARSKSIRVTPLLFGSCSPIDPAYTRIANDTGGQLFFLDPAEAGMAFGLVRPQLEGEQGLITQATGSMPEGTTEIDIPVDSSVSSLTASVTVDISGAAADDDYFAFSGSVGTVVAAEIIASREGSELDSTLTLFDSDGVTVLEYSDDAFGRDSLITFALPHDGTYYLRVSDFYEDGGANWFYRLQLTAGDEPPVGAPAMEVEPNDTPVTATAIAIDTEMQGVILPPPPLTVVLARPLGEEITADSADATITNLSSGTIITVAAPSPGLWHLRIEGQGTFSALAVAQTTLQFRDLAFVTRGGRMAHEGYARIPGQPVIGASQLLLAEMDGPLASATFHLVEANGAIGEALALAADDPNAGANQFVGTFVPSASAFSVAVTGEDASGFAYQRLFPGQFQAQGVEVSAEPSDGILRAGETKTLSFTVRNRGTLRTFTIMAADDRGFVSGTEPTETTLAADASETIEVDLTVPADAAPGTHSSLSVVATAIEDPTIGNSATLLLSVAEPEPTSTPSPITTPSDTPSPVPPSTPTTTPTATVSRTASATASLTASATTTATPTTTASSTATDLPTPSATDTATFTATPTATAIDTASATATATATMTATSSATQTAIAACVGDCGGNGLVTVDELITGVNIALGTTDRSACSAVDADGDGSVAINELIAAVNAALRGC